MNNQILDNLWRFGDPRYAINKRDNIIILRPITYGHWMAGTGHVDTKEGWSITTDFKDHKHIDEWNKDWVWCFAPKVGSSIFEERIQKMEQDTCKSCGYYHPGGTCLDS